MAYEEYGNYMAGKQQEASVKAADTRLAKLRAQPSGFAQSGSIKSSYARPDGDITAGPIGGQSAIDNYNARQNVTSISKSTTGTGFKSYVDSVTGGKELTGLPKTTGLLPDPLMPDEEGYMSGTGDGIGPSPRMALRSAF